MRTRNAIVVRAADRNAANAALARQGYGPATFSVELIPTAQPQANPPATHYGCSWSMTVADITVIQKALAAAGVTFSVRPQNTSFDESIAADGYKRVQS